VSAIATEAMRDAVWGRPDWDGLRAHPENLEAALPMLRVALSERTESAPFALTRAGAKGEAATATLIEAISSRSPEHIADAARDLAGLGEGSTPAGDDFLVGVMYGVHATRPGGEARRRCESIAATATPRTTRVSALWLQRAAGGEAIPTWNLFLAAIADGEPAAIRSRADQVLGLGHTSGFAALSGFVAAVERLCRPQGERA
jgi:uncharacterized protein DUF2877